MAHHLALAEETSINLNMLRKWPVGFQRWKMKILQFMQVSVNYAHEYTKSYKILLNSVTFLNTESSTKSK